MAKKTGEPYFTTSLNIDELKRLKPNVTSQEIERPLNDYKKLIGRNRHGNLFLPKLVQLNGKKGEIAYVRDDSHYQHPKITLITEFPLSLSVGEQRKWISMASKFFKPKFEADSETVIEGQRPKRIQKPYHIFKTRDSDLGNIERYSKKFSDSAPYGSVSGLIDCIKKRNQEMKKEFWYYRGQGDDLKKCLYQVKMWLKKQTIWSGRKGYKELSSKTILRICYSRSM